MSWKDHNTLHVTVMLTDWLFDQFSSYSENTRDWLGHRCWRNNLCVAQGKPNSKKYCINYFDQSYGRGTSDYIYVRGITMHADNIEDEWANHRSNRMCSDDRKQCEWHRKCCVWCLTELPSLSMCCLISPTISVGHPAEFAFSIRWVIVNGETWPWKLHNTMKAS